jgi:hypothetical protein
MSFDLLYHNYSHYLYMVGIVVYKYDLFIQTYVDLCKNSNVDSYNNVYNSCYNLNSFNDIAYITIYHQDSLIS